MLKTAAQLSEEARKDIPEISVSDVGKDLTTGTVPFILIDVREPQEHLAGIIPGAQRIPRGLLELEAAKFVPNENTPIVCYCGGGTRSLFAAQQLKQIGYRNVKSMAGGFKAWTTAGHPVSVP